MPASSQQLHVCTITGDVENDRHYFNPHLLRCSHTKYHFRLDLSQLRQLNLVTLGLIAWISEQVHTYGHSVEYVNTSQTLIKIIELYKLA